MYFISQKPISFKIIFEFAAIFIILSRAIFPLNFRILKNLKKRKECIFRFTETDIVQNNFWICRLFIILSRAIFPLNSRILKNSRKRKECTSKQCAFFVSRKSTSCKIIFEFAAIFIVRSVRRRKVCIRNEECRKFPIFVGKYRGTRYEMREKFLDGDSVEKSTYPISRSCQLVFLIVIIVHSPGTALLHGTFDRIFRSSLCRILSILAIRDISRRFELKF